MNALLLLLGTALAAADGPNAAALELADLPAYRAALEPIPGPEAPAVAVGFRDLWDHPERYQGRRVQLQGRVVRRFQQDPLGTFPALTEAWVVSAAGDPFCLVFPAPDPPDRPALGDSVRFTGTFLKPVRYQAGDTARQAPLIVGSRPPAPAGSRPAAPRAPGFTPLDWGIGIAATAVVILILARQFLRRPRRRRDRPEPPPVFWSPPVADPEDTRHETPDTRHDDSSPRAEAARDVPPDR